MALVDVGGVGTFSSLLQYVIEMFLTPYQSSGVVNIGPSVTGTERKSYGSCHKLRVECRGLIQLEVPSTEL